METNQSTPCLISIISSFGLLKFCHQCILLASTAYKWKSFILSCSLVLKVKGTLTYPFMAHILLLESSNDTSA